MAYAEGIWLREGGCLESAPPEMCKAWTAARTTGAPIVGKNAGIALALVVLVAGCAESSPRDDACGDACTAEPPVPTSASPGTPRTNTSAIPLDILSLASCRGWYVSMEIPAALASEFLPEPFTPVGLTSATATAMMLIADCARLTTPLGFDEDSRSFWTFIWADPTPDGWRCEGINAWLIEAGADQPSFWNSAFPNVSVEKADVGINETRAGPARIDDLSVRTQSFTITTSALFRNESGGGTTYSHCYWFGAPGNFQYLQATLSDDQDLLVRQPRRLQTTGDGPTTEVFAVGGTCTITPLRALSVDFQRHNQTYKAMEEWNT